MFGCVSRFVAPVLVSYILLLQSSPCALAQESAAAEQPREWAMVFDSAFYGKYVWRGINTVNDPVWQPALTFSWRNFSFNAWGNMDLTDQNDQRNRFTEVDLTGAYNVSWRGLDLSTGAVNYQFPNPGAPATTEIFASARVSKVPLSPTLALYQDVDEARGMYANLALSRTFPAFAQWDEAGSVALDAAASAGFGSSDYNHFYHGVGRAAFSDALVSVGLPISLSKRCLLRPSANASSLLDGRLRDVSDKADNVWFGLSLNVKF